MIHKYNEVTVSIPLLIEITSGLGIDRYGNAVSAQLSKRLGVLDAPQIRFFRFSPTSFSFNFHVFILKYVIYNIIRK